MGEELAVCRCCVGNIEEFVHLGFGCTAYTLVYERVVEGVEDAVAGGGVGEEDIGGSELGEIAGVRKLAAWWRARKKWIGAYCSRMSRTSSRRIRFLIQM